ncbi:hypothetical protein AKJ09_06789 [Labilithrix luteola]|uniref:Uncharacterized protein n=1 Tax=Labilithrix luteola TaxID=1391654 RepID=A0A0K1Q2T5_9BACT|nr:hypothetical protein [Labilithrix luteola]AKV00126.1 hypothetical protein AKJ09_06789 [Labilithrix luteola]
MSQNAPVVLTPDALARLNDHAEEFLVRCGDRFVTSVTFKARVVALITYETSSEDRAQQLQAGISGNAPLAGGAVNLDASVKTHLSNASKLSDVKTSVHMLVQGFNLSSSDPLFGIDNTLPDKLKRLDEVGQAIARTMRRMAIARTAPRRRVTCRNTKMRSRPSMNM